MKENREERIRAKAYELWEREGRSGDPQDHWLQAERDVGGASADGDVTSQIRSTDAEKMADQVKVAMDARKGRSKQTGRAGATALKKGRTGATRQP